MTTQTKDGHPTPLTDLDAARDGRPGATAIGTLDLISIHFDHDSSVIVPSVRIRRSHATPIRYPEWQAAKSSRPEHSPVAYSIHDAKRRSVFVKVRLQVPDPAIYPVTVEVRAKGGGVLGAIDPVTLEFDGPNPADRHIRLPNHEIGTGSVRRVDVTWEWEYRVAGTTSWQALADTSHRVYLLLRNPEEPWTQVPGHQLNPWTSAMDLLFDQGLAGSADPDASQEHAVLGSLAEILNRGGAAQNPFRVRYDIADGGTPRYNGDLTKLLERAQGGNGLGERVNCDDMAHLMAALANLVGCDLWVRKITGSSQLAVMPIGYGQWWTTGDEGFMSPFGPYEPGLMNYHMVAWKGSDNPAYGRVYDTCFLVNDLADPDDPERSHMELRSIRFAYGDRFSENGVLDYIERLSYQGFYQLGPRVRPSLR